MTIDDREMNRRLIRLSESPTSRFWRLDYKDLSIPERVFLVIWELESEVNNGGFQQYFYNSSGALAPHVVSALKAIGAQGTSISYNARLIQWLVELRRGPMMPIAKH